jgi:hypothetical protein
MSADRLQALLASGGLAPANVPHLAALCNGWFNREPTLTAFALRSIFNELHQDWDCEQGMPDAVCAPFDEKLLPELNRLLSLPPDAPHEQMAGAITALVITFHDCRSGG